ncbi:hypothetical protein EG832_02750 [bacterium]|nr:hypothetical protein [bacterium]
MKKTVYFSLVAFLILWGCSKSDDFTVGNPDESQLKSATANGSVSWYTSGGYYIPLVCDDIQVDFIFGWPIEWHVIDHYKNGQLDWTIYQTTGTLTNRHTGEIFKIQESDRLIWNQEDYSFHANLIGDQGSHYILSGRFDPITFEVFVDKAVCPSGPQNQE